MSSQNYRVYLHFFSPKDSLIKRRGRGGANHHSQAPAGGLGQLTRGGDGVVLDGSGGDAIQRGEGEPLEQQVRELHV